VVILDTNIIIDHLRKPSSSKSELIKLVEKNPKETLALSVISIQELYEGRSTKELEKEEKLISTVAPLKILSYTYEIAQRAGVLARDMKNPIEFADCAIAATTLYYKASLVTLDKKSYQGIDTMKIVKL